MTATLTLPSFRSLLFGFAGLCLSLALFGTISIQQAHAQGLTAAQAEAIVGVLQAFSPDQNTVGTVATGLNDAVAMGSVSMEQTAVQQTAASFDPAPKAPLPQVVAATIAVLPTCTLAASSTSISPGQPVMLSWSGSNATSASMPGGITNGAPSGSLVEHPLTTTAYQKTVYNPYGSGTCQTTVTVIGTTAAPIPMQAAAVEALDLVDNTFSPFSLAGAAAVVLAAPVDILTDGLTDYFYAMGVR